MSRYQARGWAWILASATLAGCGGGGGGSDTPSASVAPPATPVAQDPRRIEPYEKTGERKSAELAAAATRALRPTPLRIRLGPVEASALPAAANGSEPGKRRQIGLARAAAQAAVVDAASSRWNWQPLPGGGSVAAVSLRSDGAVGVRLGLVVNQLPDAAIVRVYAQNAADEITLTGADIRATLARNADAGDRSPQGRTYWLPAVQADEATLEIELPAGVATTAVDVSVPRLSHLYARASDVQEKNELKIGQASACNVDAACSAEALEEGRSVAKMEFVEDGSAFLCTGTLLADRGATGTPYFLSANHCIPDQTTASTITTYWFYRAAACNSQTLNSTSTARTGGAVLLYASATTETSFMRLNAAPPTSAIFAGSVLDRVGAGTGITALHHPRGDLLKISRGSVSSYSRCAGTLCTSDASGGEYLSIHWTTGVTEAGSSGSAAFTPFGSRRYVVGQLFAGSASCSNPSGTDHYGRFDLAYESALKRWLEPTAASSATAASAK